MRNILLLEDEPGIAEMLVIILEQERYKVHAAANGLEALHIMKQTRPDVILTDVMMPGMGGLEFCQLVRADPSSADIPIVFQTSVEEWAVREHFQDFDAFFLKPYDMKSLLGRVALLAGKGRDLLSRAPAPVVGGAAAGEGREGSMQPELPAGEGGGDVA